MADTMAISHLIRCMDAAPRGRGFVHDIAGVVHGRILGASAVALDPASFRVVRSHAELTPGWAAAHCPTCNSWTEHAPVWECELRVA